MTAHPLPSRRRADMRVTGNRQPQHARALCRRHAATLFATATLLIDDTDKACDVVADVIAEACAVGAPIEPSSEQALTALVASVIRRCAALLGPDDLPRRQPLPDYASPRSG
jgi:hypothetical protein